MNQINQNQNMEQNPLERKINKAFEKFITDEKIDESLLVDVNNKNYSHLKQLKKINPNFIKRVYGEEVFNSIE